MKFLISFFNILWRLWFVIIAFIYIIPIGIFIVLPLSFSNKTFPIAYKLIQFWGTYMFYGMGFSKQYEKKTQLDKNESYIFIANHTSIIDIILMLHVLKSHPIVFVGKAELLKIPIFGRIYKQICIPVDRTNLKSRAQVFPLAKERLNAGLNIFIFPEGGVSDDTSITLDKFKDGAFSIAIETKTPIAIFTIIGLKKMFPFDNFKGYPGKTKVILNEIVKTEHLSIEDKNDLKDYCHKVILEELEKYPTKI